MQLELWLVSYVIHVSGCLYIRSKIAFQHPRQTKFALHNIHMRKRINRRNPLRQTNLSLSEPLSAMQTPTHLPYLSDIFIYFKNCQISVFKREILQRIYRRQPETQTTQETNHSNSSNCFLQWNIFFLTSVQFFCYIILFC